MSGVVVKKYVVRLSKDERAALEALIINDKHTAATILKARVLLEADSSEGEGWNDSRIVTALDTSLATVSRTHQRVVEEGFTAVLARRIPQLGPQALV